MGALVSVLDVILVYSKFNGFDLEDGIHGSTEILAVMFGREVESIFGGLGPFA